MSVFDGLLGELFEGAGRLGSAEASAQRQRAQGRQRMYNLHLSQLTEHLDAAEAAQRGAAAQVAQSELIAAQLQSAAQGMVHVSQDPAGAVRAQGPNHTGVMFETGFQPNMFTRWLDIRDSEDELQEFLKKCVDYGLKFKSVEKMSAEELDAK